MKKVMFLLTLDFSTNGLTMRKTRLFTTKEKVMFLLTCYNNEKIGDKKSAIKNWR